MDRVTIRVGNNSAESEDFARMLREMYAAWDGPVEQEHGVHGLTYISPFDEQHRRHTTFVGVEVEGAAPMAEGESVIRRYVLHPYELVRDYGLKRETARVRDVLAGDLSALLEGEEFTPPPPMQLRKPTDEDVKRANEALDEMRDEQGRLPWEKDNDDI